jgi:hypothetical protein
MKFRLVWVGSEDDGGRQPHLREDTASTRGDAHVADRRGNAPESPASWGWLCNPTGHEWIPEGSCIGRVIGSDLFLEPATSYRVTRPRQVPSF